MRIPTRGDVLDSHDQLRGAVLFAIRTIRKMRSRDEVCVEAALLKLSKVLAEARTLRDAIPARAARGEASRRDVT